MGDTKLEISGKTSEEPPTLATFKPISESDTEETALQKPKPRKNMSESQNSTEADGADEKMLSNEEKPLTEDSKIDIADAKSYSVNADKQNGEVKLDIDGLKPAFVGMGKEELMKYANDPFWVRLRWILFISFWLIWLAMLIGAVLIIIAAPKCAPPTPRTWWERGPLVEISSDVDSSFLQELKDKKVQGAIINIPIDSYKPINSSELNEIHDFLKIAKEKDLNVIIGLKPTSTDEFFFKSESKVDEYSDYYIWADSKGRRDSGEHIEPNNWLSPDNKKAWIFSNKRQQFYYSPERLPALNFRNPRVIDEFTKVLEQWLALGIKGVQLHGVPHLLVDESLRNWTMGSEPGHIHDEYEFYSHSQTENVEGIAEILKDWRKVVKTATDGPFMLAEDLTSLDAYNAINNSLTIDLPRHSNVFIQKDRVSSALQIYNGINSAFTILGSSWPIWKYEETTLEPDVMNILTMLLPGSILINPDIEINPQLFHIRDVPSIMFGSYHQELLMNETVFAYQRVQTGNPGYIVACNPGDKLVTVDFSSMKNVSIEVTVQVLSSNYSLPDIKPSLKVSAKTFKIPPLSAAVLTYVPKSNK